MGEPARKMNEPAEVEDAAQLRALATQGLPDWFSSLPDDDWTDALDESAFTPVRWVDGVGFVQAPT